MKKTIKKMVAFLSALTISASMVCSFGASANYSSQYPNLDYTECIKPYLVENSVISDGKELIIEENLQEFLDKYAVNDDISKTFEKLLLERYDREIAEKKAWLYVNNKTGNISVVPYSFPDCSRNSHSLYLGVVKYNGKYRHAYIHQLHAGYNQTLELCPIEFEYNYLQRVADEKFDGDVNSKQIVKQWHEIAGADTLVAVQEIETTNASDYYYRLAKNYSCCELFDAIDFTIPDEIRELYPIVEDEQKFYDSSYDEQLERYISGEKYIEMSDNTRGIFIYGSELPKNSPYHPGNDKVWKEVLDEIVEELLDKDYKYIEEYAKKYTNEELVKMVQARIEGDANCDGKTTIADAILVMQSVSNADKYQLTDQGMFNADFNGDGITTLDAKKIQELLLVQ